MDPDHVAAEGLASLSAQDGSKLAECELASPPVFDGLIAAAGRLFLSLRDGSVVCLAGDQH